MHSTHGLGGMISAIVWILVNDVVGGLGGIAAGSIAMAGAEPVLGGLAGCVLLVTVPLGLCAGGLMGVASLGWMANLRLAEARPALSHS